MVRTITTSKPCNWILHIDDTKYMVENTVTGFVDFPIIYNDQSIAYDFPERIPKYFRSFVESALQYNQ